MSGNLAELNFNPSEMPPPRADFELIPPGTYSAIISDCEFRNDGTSDGTNITLKIQITGPEHVGRIFFENLYVKHSNENRARIAQETLQKVCIAVGWEGPLLDTSLVENKPFNVKLDHETSKTNQKTYINVKSWQKYDPAAPGATAAKPATNAPQFAAPAAAPSAAPQPTATAEHSPPPWSDDVPF
tara:strand:+ start:1635 stop:2192 length:558 start_codon:yes stop_codon:yes gene_type:complete